jgi:hypothetical protein
MMDAGTARDRKTPSWLFPPLLIISPTRPPLFSAALVLRESSQPFSRPSSSSVPFHERERRERSPASTVKEFDCRIDVTTEKPEVPLYFSDIPFPPEV